MCYAIQCIENRIVTIRSLITTTVDFNANNRQTVHREPNKHTKNVILIYSLQNPTDCDKIRYILSWVNLSHRNVNVSGLTWIVSLPYLVKLSICVLQVTAVRSCEAKKHTKMFLPYLLQNEADFDKVWCMFTWLNLPQCDVKVKKLRLFH